MFVKKMFFFDKSMDTPEFREAFSKKMLNTKVSGFLARILVVTKMV